ncbi:MAG TPA: hypothetical protein VMF30_19665 [Pirellulales bacterium]|nr:hypothetical protein [Pirellulales bacterium]
MENFSLRRGRAAILGCLLAAALASAPGIAQATDLTGCWSGYWQSCSTGHEGPLCAVFSKCGDNRYQVAFSGRFFKIFPFHYTVTLNVKSDDGKTVVLAGSNYLGRLFGTFTYQANATGSSFSSNYWSNRDSGKFVLSRS